MKTCAYICYYSCVTSQPQGCDHIRDISLHFENIVLEFRFIRVLILEYVNVIIVTNTCKIQSVMYKRIQSVARGGGQ